MIEADAGNNWLTDLSVKHHMAIAFVCLALLEIVYFGTISRHVGFYLDDWTTLCTLKFGPQSLPQMIAHYFFVDPKVIIRPVEVLQFACLFKLFGLKPFGYHVFNAVLEVLSAWLLYLCLVTYSKDRSLSFMAALLLLLLPLHDSTHYWMLASSVTLSLAFYLLSLYLNLTANQKPIYYLLAALAFSISIFSYESFLPLCAINCACAWTKQAAQKKAAFGNFLLVPLSYFLSIALLLAYQRILVPHIGIGWIHEAHFDLNQIFHTVCQGVAVLLPTNTLPAFAKLIATRSLAISAAQTIWLAAAALLTGATFYLFSKSNTTTNYFKLILIGAATVLLSYTIFGLNPEYTPTLYSLVNRINAGAAIGLSIIIASFVGLLLRLISNTKVRNLSGAACAFVVIIPLILANWSMSDSWILSWQTQEHVRQAIENQKDKLTANNSIMLANCPRYVDWAPVYDGVWDFQSMVRIALNNSQAKGSVVSDRLQLFADHLADISCEYVCGTYPYQGMYCLFPATGNLVPIHSAIDFVTVINKDGRTFDLTEKTISKWKNEISLFKPAPIKDGQKIASPSTLAKTAI